MRKTLIFLTMIAVALSAFAAPAKKPAAKKPAKNTRDIKVVREYIKKRVGPETLKEIQSQEGGKKFLETFFADQEWMEEFAGSGPVWTADTKNGWEGSMGAALKALDLLVWNDRGDFITSTKIGRNIATSFALNHGNAVFVDNNGEDCASERGNKWDKEKLVTHMEAYREWYKDGTLDDNCRDLNTRQWREVTCAGQNSELTLDDLRWIHDFSNTDNMSYGSACWTMAYRMNNCFGASVHGPMYYKPWEHRWNTQELRYRVGGVCGAISKFGSQSAASHGIRAYTAGQPGHCAFQVWDPKKDRWTKNNDVTGDTGSHFSFSKRNDFGATNETLAYYQNPEQMNAEYLRWQGYLSGKNEFYMKSMALCQNNWHAAKDWQDKIKTTNQKEDWDKYATVVRKTFPRAPSLAWDLYAPYLDSMGGNQTAKMEAAKLGLAAFKEPEDVPEVYLFGKRILSNVLKGRFSNQELWTMLPSMLDGQSGTPHYYNDVVSWASTELGSDPADAMKVMKILVQNSLKNKQPIDYSGMIQTASNNRDLKGFKQAYKLMDKLPDTLPKNLKLPKVTTPNKWPSEAYDGKLLSPEAGLALKDVSHCTPLTFRYALTPDDTDTGVSFHTGKDIEEWAEVFLPGPCTITGVTIVNTPGNSSRQVPIAVQLSEDGTNWGPAVWSSKENKPQWEVPIRSSAQNIKFVRVVRTDMKPDAQFDDQKVKEHFHLKKILVYGKKNY